MDPMPKETNRTKFMKERSDAMNGECWLSVSRYSTAGHMTTNELADRAETYIERPLTAARRHTVNEQ